jgi:hypothetical protein
MWDASCCIRTDGRTRRSLIAALRNFANAPKKTQFKIQITRMKNRNFLFPTQLLFTPLQQRLRERASMLRHTKTVPLPCLDEYSQGTLHTDMAHDTETPGTERPSAGRVLLSCMGTAHHTANEMRRQWRRKINLY